MTMFGFLDLSPLQACWVTASTVVSRVSVPLPSVIIPDGQPLLCHPHPRKPMRGPPKALLEVSDPYRGQLRPPSPFDDLLIKSSIEVGLVMVMTGKVHVNVALTDQVFERTPDKP